MAAAANKKQQTPPAAASVGEPAAVVDPKFEWAEKAGSYVLRITLPGFRKADFRVQVDGAGRLTVRGTRTGTAGTTSLCKVFQLPSAASLDDIAGRFEAGVLTLTVPKRASSSATTPASIEGIKRKLPGVATPKEEDASKKKAMDEATEKVRQQQTQEEASKSKQESQKPAPAQVNTEEEIKPKAPQATIAPPQEPAPVKKEEEMKPKARQAAAAVTSTPEKAKAAVAPESLAERVRQRGEEEQRAKAAAAAKKEATTEQEKKAAAADWKERAMGELKGLTNMKWAEGLTNMKWADSMVEAARNNKEVVAVGIAAFSVGFLVSQKLFRK
ncbi:unnamed protein product [Alopecurus aequalis]